MKKVQAFIGLGANLGDRLVALQQAVEMLNGHADISVIQTSPVYMSKAHTLDQAEQQPDYLNAVIALETTLTPETLMAYCHHVEKEAGRERVRRWEPRLLDLDILLYGETPIRTGELIIPHPRMGARRFVLQPLADLAPNLYLPEPFDMTVTEALRQCPDTDRPERTAYALRISHAATSRES